ncbi:MAG: hypothetical protein V3T23_13225 [Nitrososphaerales archaeon]
MDNWALRRVAAKLLRLGPGAWELLQGLGNGDSPGKAKVEIVDSGAN